MLSDKEMIDRLILILTNKIREIDGSDIELVKNYVALIEHWMARAKEDAMLVEPRA